MLKLGYLQEVVEVRVPLKKVENEMNHNNNLHLYQQYYLYGFHNLNYPELDNLTYIKEKNLLFTLKIIIKIINEIQKNKIYVKKQFCEVFLTKYKLMSPLSFVHKKNKLNLKNIFNFLAFCDLNNDTTELKKICNVSDKALNQIIKVLKEKKIIQQYC